MYYLIVIAVLIVYFILSYDDKQDYERFIRKIGAAGEAKVSNILDGILNDDDYQIDNVHITFAEERAELDKVVINNHGIFIIEVKNYTGRINGRERDKYWTRYKEIGTKRKKLGKINNPLFQLKREIWILGNYLSENDVDVWINGCVYMVNANRPFLHRRIVNCPKELDETIHHRYKQKLSDKEIKRIIKLLNDRHIH